MQRRLLADIYYILTVTGKYILVGPREPKIGIEERYRKSDLQDYEFTRLGHEYRPEGEAEDEAGEGAHVAGTEDE
ncbi:hypothetical protein CHU98_g3694 [Xylaria longipes]|nr:hypothetical protein CHU98_g3694 [Xylaria longipes]